MTALYNFGWRHEKRMSIVVNTGPGPVDAVRTLPNGRQFVVHQRSPVRPTQRDVSCYMHLLAYPEDCGGFLEPPIDLQSPLQRLMNRDAHRRQITSRS